MSVQIFDPTPCQLGEGPLWHPTRNSLIWFDILGRRMYERAGDKVRHWQFDAYVSAAGWVDDTTVILASQTALSRFDLSSGQSDVLVPLEADKPVTRSNDGRADPYGGFWIGTMGIDGEADAGAIYRFYRGELRQLFAPITISNSISFAPDGGQAYLADTPTQQIMRVALDSDGWPLGDPEVWIDLRAEDLYPDGSEVDSAGNLWNAQWGAGRVACYGADGQFLRAVSVPTDQTTCPAFGGPDLKTLIATTAAVDLDDDPDAGKTFAVEVEIAGQAAHRVLL